MALYLVGETIDAKSASRRAQNHEITQLTRGVYVADADGDADPLRYAIRIAHYLYPKAYLSSASALTLDLKNLAVLRSSEPGSTTFASVRFAPLYDAVSTRVFPRLAGDRMALKLNGRDDHLGVEDFVAAAKTMGISSAAARAACHELAERLSARALTLQLPASAQNATTMLSALVSIIEVRTTS
ncbi:MAG TPA: hypothetical protein VFX59_20540 [Polyangiales bacterium]|nr:hypothetical protein [Polyangiales bacterium]